MTRYRRAVVADAPAIAALHRRTRLAGVSYPHSPEEDVAFFAGRMIPEQDVWVAEEEGVLLGYAAATPGRLNHLFVAVEAQGRGIGSSLMNAACPTGPLRLWTFQRNHPARRFYEARGFRVERFTDGADNEEREPDVCYVRD